MSGKVLVLCFIYMLDIEHHKIRHLHQVLQLVCRSPVHPEHDPRSVQTGVEAALLCKRKQLSQEIDLKHRLTTRCGNPARPVEGAVALQTTDDLLRCHLLPAVYIPSVGIVAVEAAHRTALKEHDKAYSRPVDRTECF